MILEQRHDRLLAIHGYAGETCPAPRFLANLLVDAHRQREIDQAALAGLPARLDSSGHEDSLARRERLVKHKIVCLTKNSS